MTVKAFLAESEKHLRRGDIILSRSPTLTSWLIRKATGSNYSHASLVFLLRQPDDGFENSFVLESTREGVGIANLRQYIAGRSPEAEIAVLRIDEAQFDEKFFKIVRGLMLDHVRSGYDYGKALRLALSGLFGLRLGWSRISKGQHRSMQDAVVRTKNRLIKWLPPEFICSGFIQYGFLIAAVRQDLDVSKVIFRPGIDINNSDALLAVTPEDIATSDKLRWLLVARRGWVHQVRSREEAMKLG